MAPAIVHDYLYWYQTCKRPEADAVLMVGMRGMETGRFKSLAIYQGVSDFGKSAFSKNRRLREKGEIRTLTPEYLADLLASSSSVDPKETWSSALAKAKRASGLLSKEAGDPQTGDTCKAALAQCKECRQATPAR